MSELMMHWPRGIGIPTQSTAPAPRFSWAYKPYSICVLCVGEVQKLEVISFLGGGGSYTKDFGM